MPKMPACGTYVDHPAFGRGRVIKTETRTCYLDGEREPALDARVTVRFESGEKELLWAFCHTKVKIFRRRTSR